MDRQHPRDLSDLFGLFEQDGLTPAILECLVRCLAGPNRPVHEVLFSRDQELPSALENESIGMTRRAVTLEQLTTVRRQLKAQLPTALTENHRHFLVGLVTSEPEWSLMQCARIC